jgi:hypothetical protein
MNWLICCSSAWADDPKETIEPVFDTSISPMRFSISAARKGLARSNGTTSSTGTGSVTRFSSSTISSAFAASIRTVSDIGPTPFP